MSKRHKRSSFLPQEVVLHILLLVPDQSSFFALLEAFQGTTVAQGPMAAAWNLGRTVHHVNMWPSLKLHPMRAHVWELAVQAIPAYTTVEMYARNELPRLVGLSVKSTKLVVVDTDTTPDPKHMQKWFADLAQLPVHTLRHTPDDSDLMATAISHLCQLWPSMEHLRSLNLTVGDPTSLKLICTHLGKSQIADLCLQGPTTTPPVLALEGQAWTDVMAWLQSAKVVKFQLFSFQLISDDVTVQALNRVFASSDAIDTINWTNCTLHLDAPLALPPRLRHLDLTNSTFERVELESYLKMLPTLPQLTHLDLSYVRLTPADVDTLASALVESSITTLHLDNACPDDGPSIQRLADAFEATASLHTLRLAGNNLGFNDVQAILLAVERRPHLTKEVVFPFLHRQHFAGRRIPRNVRISMIV